MEAIHSSETSVHTKTAQYNIPENGILHSHHRENLNLTAYRHTAISYFPRAVLVMSDQPRLPSLWLISYGDTLQLFLLLSP
jgi:hypothetical protein